MINKKYFKTEATNFGKDLAYSPLGRRIARQILSSSEQNKLRNAIAARGFENVVRRLASENLDDGLYYAKLTIKNWQKFNGKPFKLFQGENLVYGNQIEPPARGFALEYRNIIVSSSNAKDFSLNLDTPFDLKIGRGAFTTPEQIKYDTQYGVEQHNDVYYSLRGNTKNPKKILITFPGFGPSTTRISYAVSYMKALTDVDLQDCLMICFQDRYLAAGSYMMVDNSGRPLYKRVKSVIQSFITKFHIEHGNILFFGASKGGSIAIHYAREFPKASLLLAVPQMNLPYYFNKPFFRDNLFKNKAFRSLEQPQEALLNYFKEGRKIDYFYTNDDELSNRSIIEFAKDVPNLTKYRIDGVHGAVARKALPTMLGLMREFLRPRGSSELHVRQVREYNVESAKRVQVRVDSTQEVAARNWYLEGKLGQTTFRQILSDGSPSFLKYSSIDQQLDSRFDPINQIDRLVSIAEDGSMSVGVLPTSLEVKQAGVSDRRKTDSSFFRRDAEEPAIYSIIDNKKFEQYLYRSVSNRLVGDTLEVYLVNDCTSHMGSVPMPGVAQVFSLECNDKHELLHLILLRMIIDTKLKNLVIHVTKSVRSQTLIDRLESLEWNDIEICLD